MRKFGNGKTFTISGKPSEERAQPRKTNSRQHKKNSHEGSNDWNDGERFSGSRREPAKNSVRIQLRRIQQMF